MTHVRLFSVSLPEVSQQLPLLHGCIVSINKHGSATLGILDIDETDFPVTTADKFLGPHDSMLPGAVE